MNQQQQYQEVQAALEDLRAQGILIPSGEFRPGRDGKPEPVYIHVKHATPEQIAAAKGGE